MSMDNNNEIFSLRAALAAKEAQVTRLRTALQIVDKAFDQWPMNFGLVVKTVYSALAETKPAVISSEANK